MARKTSMTDLADVANVMEVGQTLTMKHICITGHLGKPRKEIEELIKKAGGYITASVTEYTNYLVTNHDWNGDVKKSSKVLVAERKGVKIISEAQLFELLFDE